MIEHLEALTEAQRKNKARPSALDPIRDIPNPMQETKGKVKQKKNKLVRLLQLSALAVMSHPFGAQLASWTTGAAVDCGPEWAREAVDIVVASGPHPTAIAPEAIALVHKDIDYQVKAGSPKLYTGTRSRTPYPSTSKYRQSPSFPKLDAEAGSYSICHSPLEDP